MSMCYRAALLLCAQLTVVIQDSIFLALAVEVVAMACAARLRPQRINACVIQQGPRVGSKCQTFGARATSH
jgi:hypothetical protein